MQALVADSSLPAPRRSAQGLDGGRLALLLAVLERRPASTALAASDVYALAVGGVKVVEPGADLGLALAVVSALTDQPLPAGLVALRRGRPGRRAAPGRPDRARRLAEAARLGFTQAVVPRSAPDPPSGIDADPGVHAGRGDRASSSLPGHGASSRVATASRREWPEWQRGARLGAAPAAGRLRSVAPRRSPALLHALALVAPGQPLREGIDRILQAGMGGLIVIGDGPEVLNICSGGFLLDAAFSPQRLSELAKMDGATILAGDASRIARANVHLVPNPSVATSETGTRHRTAERVARSINVAVIAISQRMATIAVYVGDAKHEIEPVIRTRQPGQPGAADPRAVQGPARRRVHHAVRARGRGHGDDARCRHRPAAGRDGRSHRRRDRGLHRRAGRRRSAWPCCNWRS